MFAPEIIISPKLEISGILWFLVWTPPLPHQHDKACVSRNYDTNAYIKLIFDTDIDDLDGRAQSILKKIRKPKWSPVAILRQYDEKELVYSIT